MKNQRTEPLKGSPVQESKPKEAKLTPGSPYPEAPPFPATQVEGEMVVDSLAGVPLQADVGVVGGSVGGGPGSDGSLGGAAGVGGAGPAGNVGGMAGGNSGMDGKGAGTKGQMTANMARVEEMIRTLSAGMSTM